MATILVTGALGQIGAELVPALRARYGADNVIATDLKVLPPSGAAAIAPYDHLDCTEPHQLHEAVRRYDVGTIYHLAALLSASAEAAPQLAWSVNMSGLYNVLEVARGYGCQVFFPSSIGAFGPTTPRDATPQVTVQRPTTIYGVTKVAGELLCDYYASRFGIDTRGLRLPGLISYVAAPGGGTTDYAVEMFYHAVRYGRYTCFLVRRHPPRHDVHAGCDRGDDRPDGSRQRAPALSQRLQRHRDERHAGRARRGDRASTCRASPIDYEIDPVRQAIADSWPRSLDDSAAHARLGLCAALRSRGHDRRHAGAAQDQARRRAQPIAEPAMPTNRLTPILEARVDELRTSGRLKGAEAVTVGDTAARRRQGAALPASRAKASAASCA